MCLLALCEGRPLLFICSVSFLLIVNNNWPSLHLVPSKHLFLALFLIKPKLGSVRVKQWGGLSYYCISSLSSCFLEQNNRLKTQFLGWRGEDLCFWMNSHSKKNKTETHDTISLSIITWCKISIVLLYRGVARFWFLGTSQIVLIDS